MICCGIYLLSDKFSVLRAMAVLWSAFGQWLHSRKTLPKGSTDREWLQRWGGLALVLEELPFDGRPLVLSLWRQGVC